MNDKLRTLREPPPPWYRHAAPWLLMAGPAIVVVASFVTLWLAVASDDGLVSADYYQRGLNINRTLAPQTECADKLSDKPAPVSSSASAPSASRCRAAGR